MNNTIDIYLLENSMIKNFLLGLLDKKKYKINIIDQSKINFEEEKINRIVLFEEDSFLTSSDLFRKILECYKKKPASIIVSNINEVFNVVRWMRIGASDYLLKTGLSNEKLMNSIEGSIEYTENRKSLAKIKKEVKAKNPNIVLPININWKTLKNDDNYDLAVVMIEININSDNRYSKSSIDNIYNMFKMEINKIANMFGGKLWFWSNNFGTLVFHFGDLVNCSTLSAITFYNGFFQMCIEKLKLKEVLNFKICINEGNGIFNNNNTEHITSDVINRLTHLTRKYTKNNCLNITDNVYKKLNPRLKNFFHELGKFQNKKVYQYRFFNY